MSSVPNMKEKQNLYVLPWEGKGYGHMAILIFLSKMVAYFKLLTCSKSVLSFHDLCMRGAFGFHSMPCLLFPQVE